MNDIYTPKHAGDSCGYVITQLIAEPAARLVIWLRRLIAR